MLAYTSKATVQAAIGAIPLSMGLSCGTGKGNLSVKPDTVRLIMTIEGMNSVRDVSMIVSRASG